jgi:hypothetical protein
MKISKVKTTDYRGPGGSSPVGRKYPQPRAAACQPAWDAYADRQAKDAAEHDKAVDGLSEETLSAMAKDLGARNAHDRRDHEQRWVMGRKAAVLRKLLGMRGAIR